MNVFSTRKKPLCESFSHICPILLSAAMLPSGSPKKAAEQRGYKKNQKEKEQNSGDSGRRRGDSPKAKHRRYYRHKQKDKCPAQHG
jgi:hypothetical protein